MTENAGIFVVRAKELSLAGGINKVSGNPRRRALQFDNAIVTPLTPLTPRQTRETMQTGKMSLMSPRHPGTEVPASPSHPSASPVKKSGYMGPPNGRGGFQQRVQKDNRDRSLLGVTVRINKGPYKGYIGIVKDATENTARIETAFQLQDHLR